MPRGYVILTEVIRDPNGMQAYARAAGPTLAEFGGRVLVANAEPDVIEGEWPATQTVVVEFDSLEAARTWYHSDAYQAAAKLRQAAADCHAIIAAGFDPQ